MWSFNHWLVLVATYSSILTIILGQNPCEILNCICLQPVGIFCILPIQNLSGYGNRLPTVQPGSFAQASFVQTLNLSSNAPLTLQVGSFDGLTNITSLNLRNNQLDFLPDGVFSPMKQLISLDLSDNSLTSLSAEAFNGLYILETLDVRNNLITDFLPDVKTNLPALNTLYMSGNPYNCSNPGIESVFELLASPVVNVVDRATVRCSNVTRVSDLDFILPFSSTPPPTTSAITTPDVSTAVPLTSTKAATVDITTGTDISATMRDVATTKTTNPPTTVSSTASEVIPQSCPNDVSLTHSGYLSWPATELERVMTTVCPYGGGVARRLCQASGKWSDVIEDQDCFEAPALQQMLADLTAGEVTEANSEQVSMQLVSLPADTVYSLQEIDTITSLAAELVGTGSTNVYVLNNTLQALDNVLVSSGAELSHDQGGQLAIRIRMVVDSLLLDALSINQSLLVLSFAHLAVGGAYLPATGSKHLMAAIKVLGDGTIVINVGGTDGDITLDAVGNATVQVTVYEDDDLFQTADCGNSTTSSNVTVRGTVLTPIISIVNGNQTGSDDEMVTITYSRAPYRLLARGEERYVCARWNTSVNCGGGGWTTKDCTLQRTDSGAYQCSCLHQGVYTLLDIPPEDIHALDISNLPLISRIIFYILLVSTIPFYLTIFITILVTKSLREVPATQSLANQSLSQGLTLLILAISYERDEVLGVCYTLGVALQYLYLVSLSWMAVYPVVTCIEIFKRLLYEKGWLIWPFVVACWAWPMVTVVYGGLRYNAITDNTTVFNCWFESTVFPSTMTYITGVAAVAVLLIIASCNIFLKCSDYDVELSTHFRLLASYPNVLLFIGIILTQYFTAAAPQFGVNPYHILLGTAGCAILCGSYFFLCNGLFFTTVRNAIFCKSDPLSKNQIEKYATNHVKNCHFYDDAESTDSGPYSTNPDMAPKKPSRPKGRQGKRGSAGQGMGYMNDYLTGQTNYGNMNAPVPLALLGPMQLNGRVRAGGKFSAEIGHNNDAFNNNFTTSTDA